MSEISEDLRQHKERIAPLHLTPVCLTQRVAQSSCNRDCHGVANLFVPSSNKQQANVQLQLTAYKQI
jgi:hypothetical protein